MPLRNRVDPFGDLHAVPQRAMFTGNRGCLVDDGGRLVRHHRGDLWIICRTAYRDWRHPLTAPRTWTPLFFLDDAVALAAGHRPCGLCRRDDYRAFRDAVDPRLGATDLNRRLAGERLRRGRGLERAANRITWTASCTDLPEGTVVLIEGRPHLLLAGRVHAFGWDGWGLPSRPPAGAVDVLTPPTSVAALAGGFDPVLDPSAMPDSRT